MKPTIDLSEQGSPEWLQVRLGKFTASKAGELMCKQKNGSYKAGRSNYITEIALERITGESVEVFKSHAMLDGTERERTASLAYQFKTGLETTQTGFWHFENYGASPDDLVGEEGGVEYKNPKAATHLATLRSKEIPEYYYWQVVQNLLVTGRDWWDFVSYHPSFPENSQLFIRRVTKSEAQDDLKLLSDEIEAAEEEVKKIISFISEV